MNEEQPVTALSPEEEAAAGWALIDRRFLRWHDDICGTHIFKGNRPVCDCGLQDALDRIVADLRASLAAEVRALPEVMWGGLVTVAVGRADVLRLIERTDDDAKER